MSQTKIRYVFLGRDGVINRRLTIGLLRSWSQFEFLPRAMAALQLLANHGFQTIVVSPDPNQGFCSTTEGELQAVNSRLSLEVALSGGYIHHVYACVHSSESGCHCRTPLSGLLRQAVTEHSIYRQEAHGISDSPADLEAAKFLGFSGTLLRRNGLSNAYLADGEAIASASCLYVAVQQLLTHEIPPIHGILAHSRPGPAAFSPFAL